MHCTYTFPVLKSHHQSHLSVETFTSLDDDEVTGSFIVDDSVEGRFVCSDEEVSTFFVLLSISQAKDL
ncbi:unnamed protein product [Rotaria magnacalcarata]